MADEPEGQDTLAPEAEDEELEGVEQPEGEGEPEEFAIEIEGEVPEDETPLIKQLREQTRDQARELAEYRRANQPQIVVGEKPNRDDYYADYETTELGDAAYDAAIIAWDGRRRAAANQETEAAQQAEVQNQQWQRQVAGYRAKATALPVQDFDQAETTVVSALPQIMQAAILKYAKAPEKVVYALYKHPATLAKLSQLTDPIELVLAVHELERNLKVTTRKAPPPPEADTIQRGSASVSPSKASKAEDAALAKGDQKTFRTLRAARLAKAG